MNKSSQKISFYFILLISFIPIVFYLKIFNGFFQQDEWYGYGWFILHKNLSLPMTLSFLFSPNVGHYTPFSLAAQHLLFSLWGMNYHGFVLVGLALHFLVIVSVYYLARSILKSNTKALYAALLFGVFASIHQGTDWVVANIATLSASLFGALSTISFFEFLKNQRMKYFILTASFLLISLLFKETTIGLFPLFFLIYVSSSKKIKIKYLSLIILIGFTYFLFRVLMFFSPNITGDVSVVNSQSKEKILYNFLTIPLKVAPQVILPPELTKKISYDLSYIFPRNITGQPGTSEFETFSIKRIMEGINILFGLSIIFSVLFIISRGKINKNSKNILLFSLSWIIVNSFIFALAPENPNIIFVIDSRNLYFASIGVSILIIHIITLYAKKQGKFFMIFVAIFFFNVFWLNKNLSQTVEMTKIRKEILDQITDKYPSLPKKVIIYTASDSSYYGLPDYIKILPFQSGFGQTLLAWYYSRQNFPPSFFDKRYLWDIKSEGYEEINGVGFGYFRDYELLIKTIKEYNLSEDTVIAFSWSSKTNKIEDITYEIRNKIKKDVKKNR